MSSSRPSAFVLTGPGRLRLYSTAELLRMPPPTWLIQSILPMGGLIGLYGPPGHGKSFVAIDIAMSVATARPWQGFPTQPGLALYVSAEGGTGISKRVRAWLNYYAIPTGRANMAWLVEAMTVNSDSDDLDVLINRLDIEMERWPTLIILDTLARCFDGDENQQQDMGRFIQGVDKLRMKFNATVVIVHHTRLDGARERGNTAFRGAADAMISVAKDKDDITVTNNKQKDSEEFADLRFHLHQNPEIDSCVLIAGGAGQRNADHQAIQCLAQYGPASYTDLWKRVQGANPLSPTSERTYKRTLVRLRENYKIIKENGLYALLPEAVGVIVGDSKEKGVAPRKSRKH